MRSNIASIKRDVLEFWDHCQSLTQWKALRYDLWGSFQALRVEYAMTLLGYERVSIPARFYKNYGEQLAPYDFVLKTPSQKLELNYILSPTGWMHVPGDWQI